MSMSDSYEVPEWAVSHLGSLIRLIEDHDSYSDGSCIYEAGTIGFLDAIQYSKNGPVAIVEMESGTLVDIPFFKLQRELDFFLSIPGRVGELAWAWKEGTDLKSRVSLTTYYRVKKKLLEYGVNIEEPYAFEELPLPKK